LYAYKSERVIQTLDEVESEACLPTETRTKEHRIQVEEDHSKEEEARSDVTTPMHSEVDLPAVNDIDTIEEISHKKMLNRIVGSIHKQTMSIWENHIQNQKNKEPAQLQCLEIFD
jgi:hypothetical protein